MDLTKIVPRLATCLSLIILVSLIFIGLGRGRALARAIVTFENAKQIKLAVNYFFSDNNRYPTVSEFSDPAVMNSYLSNFPAALPASPLCPQSFAYKQLAPNSYQLNFCLDAGTKGYSKGWNGETESK